MIEFEKTIIRPEEILYGFLKIAGAGVVPAFFLVKEQVRENGFFVDRYTEDEKRGLIIKGAIIGIVMTFIYYFLFEGYRWCWPIFLFPFGPLTYAVTLYFAPKLWGKEMNLQIREEHLNEKIPDEVIDLSNKAMEVGLANPDRIPLGFSYLKHKPFFLLAESRKRHLLVTGRNGMGKTSFALTIARHDLFWKRPVIFIDPKAKEDDVLVARKYANIYNRTKDLRYFSGTHQDQSCFYNPLKLGNPTDKANKLIYALNLNHQHWGKLAATFLTIIFETFDAIGEEPTLDQVEFLFISKTAVTEFFNQVSSMPEDQRITRLKAKINRMQKLKDEAFDGLQAGLIELNSNEMREVLNPSNDKKELCIEEAITQGLFLFVDVNLGDRIREMIGKLLVKDLGIVADRAQHGLVRLKGKYAGVFIDEFDSFANEDFNHFFKRARSADFAMTLLFQSRAGLDNINPYLYSQLTQNAETVVDFRSAAKEDLDSISERPGTTKVHRRSQQIDQKSMREKTGMESQSETGVFRLDPNATRGTGRGQCVIYTQEQHKRVGGQNILDLLWAWDSKTNVDSARSRTQIINEYRDNSEQEPKPFRQLSEKEKLFLNLDKKLWHSRLTHHEIEEAKALDSELRAHHENTLAL